MKDIRIAEHGNWRHLHWNAIISAYNSTPFFNITKMISALFTRGGKHRFLHDFNEQLRELVCRLTGIDTTVNYTTEYAKTQSQDIFDFREAIHPKNLRTS